MTTAAHVSPRAPRSAAPAPAAAPALAALLPLLGPLAVLAVLAVPVRALPASPATPATLAAPTWPSPAPAAGDDLQPPALPGTVLAELRLSEGEGGFGGDLDAGDGFGRSVTSLGDLDGNGTLDLAVGAPGDDDGGGGRGAVWILFLAADGQVTGWQKISATEGGFTGALGNNDAFGTAVAGLGDLNGDGIPDLAVGAPTDDDLCCEDGAVWILFLATDGTVISHKKITAESQAFSNDVDHFDNFGTSIVHLGDVDADGNPDLAVGAPLDDDSVSGSENDTGSIWILFMRPVGTVKTQHKLSPTTGDLVGLGLSSSYRFGWSVGAPGDLDGDGTPDLLSADQVHAFSNFVGRTSSLRLDGDGSGIGPPTVVSGVALGNGDHFGAGLGAAGDLDGNGVVDFLVAASGDDDAAPDAGALWVVFRSNAGLTLGTSKITTGQGGMTAVLGASDDFGRSLAVLGPTTGPTGTRLAVGAPNADTGGESVGAVHLLTLQDDTWVDQGHALAGTPGEPLLTASGVLVAGAPISFALSNALPGASSTLVVGFTALGTPFKGGVLVPSADILVSLPVSPTGEALLPAIWPAGVPGGASLYLQWWIVDAGGPKGLAASNGVGALTP